MRPARAPRLALLLALLLLAPAAAPLAAPPALPPAPAPVAGPPLPPLGGFPALRELLLRLAPAPGLERALDLWPWPFGPTDGQRLLAALDARPPLAPGPGLAVTGDVDLVEDWVVGGDLALANATVRFLRDGLAVRVAGTLTVADSVLRTHALGPAALGTVEAKAGLEVRRSTFAGVSLVARDAPGASPSLVADAAFRDAQGPGLVADRPGLEVRHSAFANLTTGLEVADAHGRPAEGPTVHNNTFEMARWGVLVGGDSAGTYRHNVARGNFQGIACITPGAADAQGQHHRPRFSENNLFTNFGEAVAGLRGIHVVTPLGNLTIPDSACDHQRPYLGPSGLAGDTTFLSSDDTLTDVRASANPTSAPALPLPLREVTAAETWTGTVALEGPVVVNHPGNLTLDDATVQGAVLLGAKANGRVVAKHSTLDALASLQLRNADDLGEGLVLGGPDNVNAATLYRCNCTLRDSTLAFGRGLGLVAAGGLLTDDTAWRPILEGNTVEGPGVGLTLANVKSAVEGNTVRGAEVGVLDVLGTTTFRDNVVEDSAVAVTAALDTFTSSGNRYEAGTLGVVGAVAGTTLSEDLVTGFHIGVLPVLPTTATLSLSNLTFNAVGLIPVFGVATVATTNLVDNYVFGLATVPVDFGDVDVPSGITCTTCWGPADEARWGNVTYVAALAPNAAPQPPWEGSQTIARGGETKDLSGTLEAPAIARSGGTLRVLDATLDLAGRWLVGAKGGGVTGGATGTLRLENATLRHGGVVVLNSTDSVITHSEFEDFPEAALTLAWNGGTYACNAARGVGAAVRFNIQEGEPLVLRRLLVEDGAGLATGFLSNVMLAQDARVEDSGITAPRGGGLFHRIQPGDAQLHRSNLLGKGAVGARDGAEHLEGLQVTPFNATDNWWGDAAGPGKGGARFDAAGDVAPLLSPHAAEPFAPALCPALRVLTAQPRDDGPVRFRDRTIDPSALGIAERVWDFGDGAPAHAQAAEVEHTFPDGGTYTVTVEHTSRSGATASATRSVEVAHTPPKPAFDAEVVDEVTPVLFHDRSTHGNPNDAPPAGWAWAWDFGDGQSSAEREPQHRYADGSTYDVRLNTTDNDGLSAETTRSIAVPHVAPVASFNVSGSLETEAYQLTDTSTHPNAPTDGIVARAWSCTDGFTSSAQNPTHKFADGGTYSCTLTVTDDDAQSDSITKSISVAHVAPVADFTNGAASELQAMAFTDTSTHPNSPQDAPPAGWTYAWDFGDGATSSDRNPSHDYADGGTYAVQLTATDNDGQGSRVTRSVTVSHVAPVAGFAFSPANPEDGETVAFTDQSTHPNAPVDSLAAWAWDFNDGATSALQNPTHVYAADGNYDVKLTVTDDDGLSATVISRVPVGNIPPIAAFTHSPANPTDLDTVQFTDQSSDPDGFVEAWHWDFGDGATSAAQNPSHKFADDGLYTVALRVTDDRGASSALERVIAVSNVPPTASFNFGPDDPVAGQQVQFADTSSDPDGTIVSWAWDFGDGATSAAQNPTHAWADGGDYTVTLTVTDDDGAPATAQRAVHVCETRLDLATLTLELCLRVPL